MEMEALRPIRTMDFDFKGTRSSPVHLSAPSTPKHFGEYYLSAPSSPSRIAQFYRDFDDFSLISSPAHSAADRNLEAEFAFDVSEDFWNPCVSADELFDGGVIKPMQLPSAAIQTGTSLPPASRAPRSIVSRGKEVLVGVLSPRNSRDSNSSRNRENTKNMDKSSPEQDRGRERTPLISSSSRRTARSLSPVRISQFPWEEEHQNQYQQQSSTLTKPTSTSSSSKSTNSVLSNSTSKGCRKWRFKDFFLFRSASEGRSADKDPLRKYTAAFRRFEQVKGSTFKNNVECPGSGSVSRSRGKVSAHELHYTANRAVSEDLKKKTFLPYNQGILGRLAFNPAVHAVANGFGFSRKRF